MPTSTCSLPPRSTSIPVAQPPISSLLPKSSTPQGPTSPTSTSLPTQPSSALSQGLWVWASSSLFSHAVVSGLRFGSPPSSVVLPPPSTLSSSTVGTSTGASPTRSSTCLATPCSAPSSACSASCPPSSSPPRCVRKVSRRSSTPFLQASRTLAAPLVPTRGCTSPRSPPSRRTPRNCLGTSTTSPCCSSSDTSCCLLFRSLSPLSSSPTSRWTIHSRSTSRTSKRPRTSTRRPWLEARSFPWNRFNSWIRQQ
mmetsp:Transcript_28116/g.43308  ORF Transcript_28116/g.43308 Transcript_28116/m.43308 type:complete len:253 (+) Transcript_28116:171-929(+)